MYLKPNGQAPVCRTGISRFDSDRVLRYTPTMTEEEFDAYIDKRASWPRTKDGKLDFKWNPLECCMHVFVPHRPPPTTREEILRRAVAWAEMLWECNCAACMRAVWAMARARRMYRQGRIDLRFNPLDQDDDFFVPVRSKPQRPPPTNAEHAEDLAYFKNKLWNAIKLPEEYRR